MTEMTATYSIRTGPDSTDVETRRAALTDEGGRARLILDGEEIAPAAFRALVEATNDLAVGWQAPVTAHLMVLGSGPVRRWADDGTLITHEEIEDVERFASPGTTGEYGLPITEQVQKYWSDSRFTDAEMALVRATRAAGYSVLEGSL